MRFLIRLLIIMTFLIPSGASIAAKLDLSGVDVTPFTSTYDTLPPTPKGTGFLPGLKSGDTVQIRYALPAKRPMMLQLDFHNIVAMSGKGTFYQLQLRRDSPTGTILYDGAVYKNDSWNESNKKPLDVTDVLTDADFARGYLDVYATALVQEDDWTIYLDNNELHDIKTICIEDTPTLRKAVEDAVLIKAKGIYLLPMPSHLSPKKVNFAVTPDSRILLDSHASADDVFAAGLLRAEIKRVCGYKLSVSRSFSNARPNDLLLGVPGEVPAGDQSYRLVTDGQFKASANTSTGPS